jgi:TetR/AcrR family transcriptional regulator, mexCD-oprJ operon repressor
MSRRSPAGSPPGGPALRSDAQRSVARILAAAEDCFTADPNAPMTAIAAAAKVSRVTLYLHFPTREELLSATVARIVDEVDRLLGTHPLETLPPAQAMDRMIRVAWEALARYRALVVSCTRQHGDIVTRHEHVMQARIRALLVRGRDLGSFRADQPLQWQVAVCYDLLVTAASQVHAGTLDADAAVEALIATLEAAYRPLLHALPATTRTSRGEPNPGFKEAP